MTVGFFFINIQNRHTRKTCSIYGGTVAKWIGSRSFSTVVPGSIPVAVRTRDHNWISFLSSFLTVLRWFPRGIPVLSTWHQCKKRNSNLIISWFGPVISLPSIIEKIGLIVHLIKNTLSVCNCADKKSAVTYFGYLLFIIFINSPALSVKRNSNH